MSFYLNKRVNKETRTRLKRPLGSDLQRFFVPECDFNFGNWEDDEVVNEQEALENTRDT